MATARVSTFDDEGYEVLGDGVSFGEVVGRLIVGVDLEGRPVLDNDKKLAGPRVSLAVDEGAEGSPGGLGRTLAEPWSEATRG